MCWNCLFPKRKRSRKKGGHSRSRGRTTNTFSPNTTIWEQRLVTEPNLTPSKIPDEDFSRFVELDSRKYADRNKLYKHILGAYGYNLDSAKPIGEGKYGKVYKIKDRNTNEIFAFKAMKLRTGQQSVFKYFKQEVFAMKKIEHKNIIKVIDHFIIRELNLSFIILEFANEGDLVHRLRRHIIEFKRPFNEEESRRYFAQISNAINYVHSRGVAHRDLKLENILITKVNGKERVKVTDFGCALMAMKGEDAIMCDVAAGTISYMAPEALRVFINQKEDRTLRTENLRYNPFKSDMWSLGICLYKMLTNKFPFVYDPKDKVESIKQMVRSMKKGFKSPPNLTKDCKNIMFGLIEYHKDRRLTINMVMDHPWVKSDPESDSYISMS